WAARACAPRGDAARCGPPAARTGPLIQVAAPAVCWPPSAVRDRSAQAQCSAAPAGVKAGCRIRLTGPWGLGENIDADRRAPWPGQPALGSCMQTPRDQGPVVDVEATACRPGAAPDEGLGTWPLA